MGSKHGLVLFLSKIGEQCVVAMPWVVCNVSVAVKSNGGRRGISAGLVVGRLRRRRVCGSSRFVVKGRCDGQRGGGVGSGCESSLRKCSEKN